MGDTCHICLGVPSNRRPQPSANSVSPAPQLHELPAMIKHGGSRRGHNMQVQLSRPTLTSSTSTALCSLLLPT